MWWHLARASGIVAWLMLTAVMLWGIVLASDLFPEHRRPAWLLNVHRWLGGLTLTFVGIHLGALVADSYVGFTLAELAVPLASDWKPVPVALGVVALWGLIVVEVSSLARRRLSKRTWRGIHLISYGVYWLTSLHGTFAGTDATNRVYVGTSIATLAAMIAATTYRLLTRGRRGRITRRTRPDRDRSPATDSTEPETAPSPMPLLTPPPPTAMAVDPVGAPLQPDPTR